MKHMLSVQEDEFAELPRAIERLGDGYDVAQRDRLMRAAGYAWPVRTTLPRLPSAFVVAERLKTLGTDCDTVVAALLGSPACEQTLPLEKVAGEFGDSVAALVQNVRWLNSFREAEDVEDIDEQRGEQAERLRRMVLAMVDDVRAVLIKLAYRTQRLHMLDKHEFVRRRALARETRDLYVPLANRLGIAQLKWEMEDLAFRCLEPVAYKRIARALEERREDRERYVRKFVTALRIRLEEAGFSGIEVFGRPKHIYSIWKKMQRKRLQLSDLFDVRAVRVLVDSVPQCYAALGVVHAEWQHIPQEFDDYIASPKPNGYQSLHTAVVGPEGKPVEVQIRTRQMNQDAELGIAAHWRYKEGGSHDDRLQHSINSLRNLLDGDGGGGGAELMENFRGELFADRVFALTPKGRILDLPLGATPLDFAYQVHTEIGHRCRGAKVNGVITPLNQSLRNGDQVEVLTAREPKPSRDWLNRDLGYLVSSRSRAKVRHWFNIRDHEQHVEDGKQILERELKRLHAESIPLEKLVRQLGHERGSELFAAIGRNDVNSAQIAAAIYRLEQPADEVDIAPRRKRTRTHSAGGEQVSVRGVGSLLTSIASCCQPVPYDPVIGFITRGKGVSVHRRDCPNILSLDDERRERLIEVAWGEEHGAYPVDLRLLAYDRHGLIRDVSQVMVNEDLNVVRLHTETEASEQLVEMRLTVEIASVEQLARTMEKLRQISNVVEVERRGGDTGGHTGGD